MANHELMKLTATQFKEGNYDKVVLAVGSCEAHGGHLAEGCDTFVSYTLSKLVADKVKGLLVAPPITYGYSGHYDSFPFTLTVSYDTITAVIYDVLSSILRNGINKILIINGHDGNIAPIEIASRKVKEIYPDARIAALDQWWVTALDLLPPETFEVWRGLGHAGEGESSIAYHMFPQYCQPEHATCSVPENLPEHIQIKWDFGEITKTAQTGDATKATAEKGKLMTDALVDYIVKTLEDLDKIGWEYCKK